MDFSLFCKLGKILLLTLLLLAEVGCSNMSAKNTNSCVIVSNVPVKTERSFQNEKAKENLPSKPDADILKGQTENKNDKENVIAKETEDKTIGTMASPKDFGFRNGNQYLARYKNDSNVKQIILVEQSAEEVSAGTLFLLVKNEKGKWQEQLQCKAYLGKNGIDKVREGDKRTPSGDFGFLRAFGVKDDPGSLVSYTKLTNTMYLCGDKEYYNQFIDVSKLDHRCGGNSEHMLSYVPQYNYGLFIDYNKERIFGKGSAIFLHCFGSYPFTLGCISVAEDNMIKILKTVDANARICIYAKE